MLLTIHNLPNYMDYNDIKMLIQSKCGLTEVILDNLVQTGMTKKVTVGLGDESDAAILVRKINGVFIGGKQLYVEDLRRKMESDQPYRASATMVKETLDNQKASYNGIPLSQDMMMMNMAMGNMYYMPVLPHTPFIGYNTQEQLQSKSLLSLPNTDAQFNIPGFGAISQMDNVSQNVSTTKYRQRNRGANLNPDSSSRWDEVAPLSRWDDGKPQHQDFNRGFDQEQHFEQSEFGSQKPVRGGRPEVFTANSFDDGPEKKSTFKGSPWQSDSFQPRNDRQGFQEYDQRNEEFDVRNEIRNPWDSASRNDQRDDRSFESRRFLQNGNGRNGPQNDAFYRQRMPQKEPNRDEFYQRNKSQDRPLQRLNERQEGPFHRQNEQHEGPFYHRNELQEDRRRNDQEGPFTHRNEPQKDLSFRRNEPQSNEFFRQNEPHVDEIYRRSLPKENLSFRRNEPRVHDQFRRNEPRVHDQFRRNELKQDLYTRNRDQRNRTFNLNPRNQVRGNTFKPRELHSNNRRDFSNTSFGLTGTKRFQAFDSARVGPRAQRPVENRKQEKFMPTKRFLERDNRGEPPQKRFASADRGDQNRAQHSVSHPKPPVPSSKLKQTPKPKQASNDYDTVSRTNRDQTWRQQAAAYIYKEMVKNLEVDDITDMDVQKVLKKKLRERLDQILPPFDPKVDPMFMLGMVEKYREKYSTDEDQEFFLTVLESIEFTIKATESVNDKREKVKGEVTKLDENTENGGPEPALKPETLNTTVDVDGPTDASQKNLMPANVTKNLSSGEAKTKVVNPFYLPLKYPPANTWIPKYPNGDKKVHHEQKNLLKLEFAEEDMYEVPAQFKTELIEQCDKLCDLFMEACDDPESEEESSVCERLTDEIADDFRKVVRVHLTKRIMNITSGLILRIYMQGQSEREVREKFFRQHSIIASNKMDKTSFVVTLKSFKYYDVLVKMGTTVVGGATFTFKPLHLTGPPRKVTKQEIKSKRQNFITSQVSGSTDNILKRDKKVADASAQDSDFDEEFAGDVEMYLELSNDFDECADEDFADDIDVEISDFVDNFTEDDLEDY